MSEVEPNHELKGDLNRVPLDWPNRDASRSIRVGHLTWHVQVMGAGPVVVLLHGTGSSAHSWADLMPQLSRSATVVVPDLPGHGFTLGASLASLTLPEISRQLDALLEALALPAPVLVAGHSAGAALALRWALDRRQPPGALVGFAPSLVTPPAMYMQWVAPIAVPIATSHFVSNLVSGLGSRTRMIERLLESTRSTIPVAQSERYARLFRDPSHVRGSMGFMAAADLAAILQQAPRLTMPLTFVLGSRDDWIPERKVKPVIERAFPEASVLRWDAGHIVHEEHAQEAAALLLETLARLPAVDTGI